MMRRISPLVPFFLLCVSMASHAVEKLSCFEMAAVADNLEDLADAIQSTSVIQEDDPVDILLRDMIDDLHIIAASESEGDLSAYVSDLENAWHNMDFDYLADSLEGVIDSFDRLLRRDCH